MPSPNLDSFFPSSQPFLHIERKNLGILIFQIEIKCPFSHNRTKTLGAMKLDTTSYKMATSFEEKGEGKVKLLTNDNEVFPGYVKII